MMRVLRVYNPTPCTPSRGGMVLLVGVFLLFCLGLTGQKVSLFQLRNAPDSTYVIGADGNSVAKWVKRDSIGIGTLSRSSDSLFYKQCPSCPKAFITLIDTSNINEMTYLNDYGSFQELVTPDGNTILFAGPAPGGVYLNLDYPNHYSILVNEADGDPDNENGVLSRSNDSLYYQKGPSYLKTFATLIDTSSINERGVPRISNDSLFYKECYVCTEYYYGKVIHPNDPDTLVGNEFGTLFKGDPDQIKYIACDTCPDQQITDNYLWIDDQGGGIVEWVIPAELGGGAILLDTTSTIMGLVSQYDIGGGNYHLKVRIPDRDS
ncbi:MAG TPA: hypothetical protein PLV12_00855, partial [Saprospiraceae bacterium]|nr:hypothetical protein [Saprospiraceae bacterium]